jgi:hypothetical protein
MTEGKRFPMSRLLAAYRSGVKSLYGLQDQEFSEKNHLIHGEAF